MLSQKDFENLDSLDPLAKRRALFDLPEGLVYLDGNSLGPLTKMSKSRVAEVVEQQWGRDLISSWNKHGWFASPERVGRKIGLLVGASEGSVLATDGTSINLFKLVTAALRLRSNRSIILSDTGNFPSDLYIAQGVVDLLGDRELKLVAPDKVEAAITDEVALVMLSHVDYRTGRLHDMKALTKKAHDAGALVLWDLCHSAGALPVELDDCDVDLAVGCTYKYLNGGPGSPAYLYVAPRLQDSIKPALSGWCGHEAPFDFDLEFRPAEGMARNLCSTPPILSMASLDAALDAFKGVGMSKLRAKSQKLTQLFIDLLDQECSDFGFQLSCPRNPDQRGSQVSFCHPEGFAIMQALIARGVVGDFRAPDFIRLGFAPLFVRYVDVWTTVATLKDIMQTQAWRNEARARPAQVT